MLIMRWISDLEEGKREGNTKRDEGGKQRERENEIERKMCTIFIEKFECLSVYIPLWKVEKPGSSPGSP